MAADVSVIGLYILDILGRPVSRIPDRGGVDFIEEIRLTVAGTAGGTVVDCAKLGLECLAAGAVGDDEKADWMLMQMQKHGIDVSAMQRISGVPTSATILNIRPNGDRPALHVRGASDQFDVPTEQYDVVLDAPTIHLDGTGLLRTLDGASSLALLREAKARGKTVTFDLIAANEETTGMVLPLLPFIDFFMPSIDEAQAMSGRDTPDDCARYYLDHGATACCFTLGGDGAYYAHRDGARFSMPAYELDVVDTTGCGDAFDAGMIAAIHHGMDAETSVRFAQAAAGLVAAGLGSDAGIISFEHTLHCMKTWKVKS